MDWAVGGLLWSALVFDPEPVVVLPRFEDGIPVPVQRRLAKQAQGTLAEHGVLAQVVDDADCAGRSCAAALGGARGVAVSITRVARDYTVTAQVLAPDGAVLQEEIRACKICRHDELAATVTEAVDAVAAIFDAPLMGTLSVVSKPSGATVRVDGDEVGKTPFEAEVPVGIHQVSVAAPGRKEATQTADIVQGKVARHAFSLSRGPVVTPRTEEGIGWGAVALGVVGVATGVALLAIDERPIRSKCSGPDTDADGDCRFRHDTLGPGAGLLIGGLVVAGGGGAWVWHGRKRRGRAPAPSADLAPRGIRGRF